MILCIGTPDKKSVRASLKIFFGNWGHCGNPWNDGGICGKPKNDGGHCGNPDGVNCGNPWNDGGNCGGGLYKGGGKGICCKRGGPLLCWCGTPALKKAGAYSGERILRSGWSCVPLASHSSHRSKSRQTEQLYLIPTIGYASHPSQQIRKWAGLSCDDWGCV